MILPAMGMVSDIIATFARKPLFGYRPMVYSIAGIAGLGFIVWGHHMFQSGMDPRLGTGFMVATIMIALPVGREGLQLAGHDLERQHPVTRRRCCSPWRSCRMFIIGGLSRHLHGRHAGGHLHPRHLLHRRPPSLRAVHASSLFGIFGGIYFWFPKMFGRMMNETLGQGAFLPDVHRRQLHVLPDAHSRRRRACRAAITMPTDATATCDNVHAAQPVHEHLGAIVLGSAQFIFVVNFFVQPVLRPEGAAAIRGSATRWNGRAPSPPPHGNFERVPIVFRGPYEYSDPAYGAADDHAMQAANLPDEHEPMPAKTVPVHA